ncbi:MAG: glycerol-3-phosphate 1-O-acyltransferase PlsY [Candidatus Binatia bacterium]
MGTVWILLFAYLLGSAPTGFFLGILSGVDIRKVGSGNIGATNVARVVGWKTGLMTLVADAAKGYLPVLLSNQLGFGLKVSTLTAVAAFVGHLYPVFLRFRGGKGVATALGGLAGLAPLAAVLLLFVFFSVAMASRLISLASLTAAALAPVVLWFLSYPPPLLLMGLIMGALIIIRHRENIERLISGGEAKFKAS